jgi:hypothetical protein
MMLYQEKIPPPLSEEEQMKIAAAVAREDRWSKGLIAR